MQIANENSFLMDYANFWSYPDPDMLQIGNGDLTIKEKQGALYTLGYHEVPSDNWHGGT